MPHQRNSVVTVRRFSSNWLFEHHENEKIRSRCAFVRSKTERQQQSAMLPSFSLNSLSFSLSHLLLPSRVQNRKKKCFSYNLNIHNIFLLPDSAAVWGVAPATNNTKFISWFHFSDKWSLFIGCLREVIYCGYDAPTWAVKQQLLSGGTSSTRTRFNFVVVVFVSYLEK